MYNLGIHGTHNASVAISREETILEVVEIERLISHKNAALCYYQGLEHASDLLKEVQKKFCERYGATHYDHVVYNAINHDEIDLKSIFPANKIQKCGHHDAHAYSALYQSPFDRCLVFSFDGGSDQGVFNVYLAEKNAKLTKLYIGDFDYALAYMTPAHFIPAIKKEQDIYKGNLVYPGKLMGYVGFGDINLEMKKKLFYFYTTKKNYDLTETVDNFISLFNKYGITDWDSTFSEHDAKEIATTNQKVFEELFAVETQQFFDRYPSLPVIVTGGCALNIINNTKLAEKREIFVPPNPNDSGLAVGLVCSVVKPSRPVDCTYIGSEVWDRERLASHLMARPYETLDVPRLATLIQEAGIVGVVRGRSEHGPRALGNRSIICDASNPEMKDILNLKIKNREPFRPFSPVVRFEDVNKFFEWQKESRWMTVCPEVKPEYRSILSSVTHVDNTARVQTVTREQNWLLYDLLTELDQRTGVGVIINTSFNVAGKPILNTYEEAFQVFDNSEMTALVLENYLFYKQ